jgi:hypothetical protein
MHVSVGTPRCGLTASSAASGRSTLLSDQGRTWNSTNESTNERLNSLPNITIGRQAAQLAQVVVHRLLAGVPLLQRPGEVPGHHDQVVDLGQTTIQLVDGTLPAAPVGTWWLYGFAGGPRTVGMRRPT